MNAEALGIQAADKVMGYETRLFDAQSVHTVDIIIDDWNSFLDTCQSEEYSVCNVLIDGEAYTNVGIRGKGNTSLSTVSSMNSERYSFKIEFDQYDNTKNYYGLDKLCLNNIIQDNTYMKDFLAYQMMEEFGVDAPLCSYVYITVNGEDWGLYLAVEGIEDGFLQRNYGNDYGELYKPDSMSFGGGRGNGKDFDMGDFDFSQFGGSGSSGQEDTTEENRGNKKEGSSGSSSMQNPFGNMFGGGQMPDMGDMSDMFGGQMPDMGNMPQGGGNWGDMFGGEMPDRDSMPQGGIMQMPEGMTIPEGSKDAETDGDESESSKSGSGRDFSNRFGGMMGGFGMGSSDVKLQYSDDNASSYSNIFNNAKTDITEADQNRLIASLKALTEGKDIASVVDIDEVLRYFVVHNFVVNGDSYTGNMIHNYYLYEEDGQLSMIPWDYNLAYGTFMGSNASGTVNDPIDSPVSGGTSDRPMIHWIFANEEYTELYHQYFAEFIEHFYDSGKLAELIDYTKELIAPYVEKDPTKFCTYEEFETGVAAIREFCMLRAESISGQLEGNIPSTSEGQSADSSNLVDASGLNISSMGTMGGSMGGGFGGFGGNFGGDRGNRGDRTEGNSGDSAGSQEEDSSGDSSSGNFGNFGDMFGGQMPDMGDISDMFGGQMPDVGSMPQGGGNWGDMFGGEMPDMSSLPQGGNFPGGSMQMPGTGSTDGDSSTDGSASGSSSSRPSFNGNMAGMPSFGTTGSTGASSGATVGLLIASVVVLLIGLLVAYKYKR